MNANEFIRNQEALALEFLTPYFDKVVAWSPDGKRILAYASDHEELFKEIRRLGLKGEEYVVGFVPDPEISYLGGALLSDISSEDVQVADACPVVGRSDVQAQAAH